MPLRCCRYCQQAFEPTKHRPDQGACSRSECQNMRRNDYRHNKLQTDPEYDEKDVPRALQKGKRYRLVFDNRTDDAHPVHLHRSVFELTSVYGKRTAGVMKDVVLVKGFQKIEVDVTPEQTGLTLFHCHQQLHMDFGFKTVFNVV